MYTIILTTSKLKPLRKEKSHFVIEIMELFHSLEKSGITDFNEEKSTTQKRQPGEDIQSLYENLRGEVYRSTIKRRL